MTTLADLFRVTTLTAAIQKLPFQPSTVGAMGLFAEQGIRTTSVLIDEKAGRLSLVPNTSRNDDPTPIANTKRKRRTLTCTHLPTTGSILPDEIQDVAAFGVAEAGADMQLMGQAQVINDKLQAMKNTLEATREYQRIGALSGKILDADGSVIVDLFKEFEVRQNTANIDLSKPATNVKKACLDAKRNGETKLGGVIVTAWRALCSPEWFDALTSHPNVEKAYANYQEASDRLGGDMRKGFVFGGIEFIECNVSVSGRRFIDAGTAQVFPVGAGVYAAYNAPANYNETVNTIGQPFYAKGEEHKFGKGWDLEAQSNHLPLCLYPEALTQLKLP